MGAYSRGLLTFLILNVGAIAVLGANVVLTGRSIDFEGAMIISIVSYLSVTSKR